jgi:hypothetical protein
MTKLSLSYNERINIIQFFPKESDMLDQVTGAGILSKARIPKEVLQKLPTDIWGLVDPESDKETEMEFTDAEIELLKNGFDKMKTDKKVTQQTVSLCIKLRDLPAPSKKEEKEKK